MVNVLEKKSYYQTCKGDLGHSTLYTLVVRRDNKKWIQYFSPNSSLHKVQDLNTNVDLIKNMFEIIDPYFYK